MMRMMTLSKNAGLELLKSISKRTPPSASQNSTATILLETNKKRIYSLVSSETHQPTLFTVAPTEENPAKKHKHRIKSSYSDNITAALELPCSAAELEQLSDKALLEKSKPHIIEHASRRVDLFFYTLIAYYKAQMQPKQGHTNLQHGSGRNLLNNKNVTQGCHSSFLPSLIDKSATSSLGNEGLLTNTHFMDSLNSTVELPPYVNELDNELENTCFCRKKCLEILSKVDRGEIDPIEGLREFLLMMDKIFNEIEANNFRIEKFFCKYRKLTSELVKLSKHGTLTEKFSTVKKKVDSSYIESLLRLTPEEKRAAKSSPAKRDKIYLAKIEEIQTEILTTKTQFSPSLS